jgi:hypothetical protein
MQSNYLLSVDFSILSTYMIYANVMGVEHFQTASIFVLISKSKKVRSLKRAKGLQARF